MNTRYLLPLIALIVLSFDTASFETKPTSPSVIGGWYCPELQEHLMITKDQVIGDEMLLIDEHKIRYSLCGTTLALQEINQPHARLYYR